MNSKRTRRNRRNAISALFLNGLFVFQMFYPTTALALTGGPSQPEFSSFTPVGDQNMVDLFTGDFSYNIPLFTIGGYPVNMTYNAGSGMEAEASWVGLGWNLTPGMINRSMQGVPDDFNGEEVKELFKVKPNVDVVIGASALPEILGLEVLKDSDKELEKLGIQSSLGLDLNFNNYYGFSLNPRAGFSYGDEFTKVDFGISMHPSGGMNLMPSLSYGACLAGDYCVNHGVAVTLGTAYNSRNGFQNISFSLTPYEKGENSSGNTVYGTGPSSSIAWAVNENNYFPYSTPETQTTVVSVEAKVGAQLLGLDADASIKGMVAVNDLIDDEKITPAYGYMNYQNGGFSDLLDYNQGSANGTFYPNQSMLSPSKHTPDIFSVQTNLMTGNFRAHRNELSDFSVPSRHENTSVLIDAGAEVAIGNVAKSGGSFKTSDAYMSDGNWEEISKDFEGFSGNPSNSLQENYVFKFEGENQLINEDYYQDVNKKLEVSYTLKDTESTTGSILPKRKDGFGNNRTNRQKTIRVLNVAKAAAIGLDKKIQNYSVAQSLTSNDFPRAVHQSASNQISEIQTVDENGNRLVFGIPVLNKVEEEYTFNVGNNSVSGQLVNITTDDVSTNNVQGDNRFFYKKQIPSYAYAYLLTGWLGAGYQDIQGDGITDDDLGQAVKFNWRRHADNFRWRSVVEEDKALFIEGLESTTGDNKGIFSYGEKELWYPQSIESKDEVAFFITSDRDDALGVEDYMGKVSTSVRQQKLDKIIIYSKPDFKANTTSATPLKVIEFVYDYSLCVNTPNSIATNQGKLTLKEVKVSHGNSSKGALSPYTFVYGNNGEYDRSKVDRWGLYKTANHNNLSKEEYPYAIDDLAQADIDVGMYNLTEIGLPSGGKISVEYERDTYGFVQDRKAQHMYEFYGVGETKKHTSAVDRLYNQANVKDSRERKYLFLRNPDPTKLHEESQLDEFLNSLFEYENGERMAYFRMWVDLRNPKRTNSKEEYVRGYVPIKSISFSKDDDGSENINYLCLELNHLDYKENKQMGALLKNVLDHIYVNHQQSLYSGYNDPSNGSNFSAFFLKFIKNLVAMGNDIRSLFGNPYSLMMDKNMAKQFVPNKSFMRLAHYSGEKVGGGHRVKKIEITDEWNSLSSSEATTTYGQEFSYVTENGKTSGVASYEPGQGNDENPFKEPIFYNVGNKKRYRPTPTKFVDGPFTEFLFPRPIVGYSRVEVRDINFQDKKSSGAEIVHEFYTSKDYPITTNHTKIDVKSDNERPLWSFLGYGTHKTLTTTAQGYVVVGNDMHGKKKKETIWSKQANHAQELVKRTEYIYDLNGKQGVIAQTGELSDRDFSTDIETFIYSRDNRSFVTTVNQMVNGYAFVVGVPVFLPPAWHSVATAEKEYRSVVTTKYVSTRGILTQINEVNRNFVTQLRNELWDAETGEVVMTSMQTEYNAKHKPDIQYDINYPAYWFEENERMGHAYHNLGYRGDVEAPTVFLESADISSMSATDKDALKKFLYRGYIDGLETSAGVFTQLSGNKVQGGVFVEGDEVYSELQNERYYVSEILNKEELDYIFSLTSNTSTTNPLNSTGGTTVGNVRTQVVTPCEDYWIDQEIATVFNELLNVTHPNTSGNALNINFSNPSFANVTKSALGDYLNNPKAIDWHGIGSSTTNAALFITINELFQSSAARDLLASLYSLNPLEKNSGQAKANAIYQVLNCNSLRSCLDTQTMNPGFISALDNIFLDNRILSFVAMLAKYGNDHYVFFAYNSPTIAGCSLVNNQLRTPKNGDLKNIFIRYDDYLNGVYSYNTTQSLAKPKRIDNSCGDVTNYYQLSLPDLCNLSIHSYDPNSGTISEEDQVSINAPKPDYDELVMFIDRDGKIVDLEGDRLEIIRSGNRNLVAAKLGSESTLNMNPTLPNTDNMVNTEGFVGASYLTYSDDWSTDFLSNYADEFNPFIYGTRGIFRVEETFAGRDKRNYDGQQNSEEDGELKSYVRFYKSDDGAILLSKFPLTINDAPEANDYWVPMEKMERYSGTGVQLQSVNALDIHSVLALDENNRVVLEGANMDQSQILIEDFENNYSINGVKVLNTLSNNATVSTSPSFEETMAHTGERSLVLRDQTNHSVFQSAPSAIIYDIPIVPTNQVYDNTQYRTDQFNPTNGEEYVLSCWMISGVDAYKSAGYLPSNLNRMAAIGSLEVTFYNGLSQVGNTTVLKPSGLTIDGWRRVEGTLQIPSGANRMELKLAAGIYGCLVDDLRVYPTDSKMVSYVYSSVENRLIATLDENNFAIFYHYAEDGALMKVERETESGRVTVQENIKNIQ